MGYRDDKEALRARVDAAESRASVAEREVQRLRVDLADAEAQDVLDAKQIAELKAKLAELGYTAPARTTARERASGRPAPTAEKLVVAFLLAVLVIALAILLPLC